MWKKILVLNVVLLSIVGVPFVPHARAQISQNANREALEPIFGKHVIKKIEVLPTPRGGTSCCYSPLNNKIYIFAGCYGGWGARTGDLFDIIEYDPRTGSVRKMDNVLPIGGDGTCCCYNSSNNKIYIFGGWNKGWDERVCLRGAGISDKIVEYDPSTGSAVKKPETLPTPRFRGSCCYSPLNDKIYIFGGAYSHESSDIIEYDPSTGSVVKKAETLPTPRSFTSCCYNLSNGKIYIFGGRHSVPFHDGYMDIPLSDIIEYDPFTGSVVKKREVLPGKSSSSSCCYNSSNNKIYIFYIFGGINDWHPFDIVEYNPVTGSIVKKPETFPPARGHRFQEIVQKMKSETLPTGRSSTSCCYNSSNDRIYIFGGHCFTGELSDIIEYRPVVPVMFVKNRRLGMGLIIGEPTGLSAKLWITENSALDGAIAWSFVNGGCLDLHADYLLHRYNILKIRKGELPLYYGIGARVNFRDKTTVGLRGVVGLEYIFDTIPIDLFLEFAPILNLIPDRNFRFNAAIGIRYFISLQHIKRRREKMRGS
ncbi:MAG: kelch repeat-containing protein [bacterium]|nr:kelch repeat-containing protein [bacterium]